MKTMLRGLALTVVGALVLSGCIKMEYNLELQSDDTVNGTLIQAVTEGFGELAADFGEGGESLSDEEAADEFFEDDFDASDFVNASIEDYNEDGWVGKKITFEGEPLSQFSSDLGELSITREGDEFVVSGPFEDAGGQDELDGMLDGAEMTMSVTFPGEVSEHNGELEGTTVTWNLLSPPSDGLQARGSATGGGDFPWLILVGLLLLVIVAAAVVTVVVISKRNSGAPSDPDAPAASTPPPPPPPATPASSGDDTTPPPPPPATS